MITERRGWGLSLATASAALQAGYIVPYKMAVEHAAEGPVVLSLMFFAALFNSLTLVALALRREGSLGAPPAKGSGGLTTVVTVALAVLSAAGNAAVGAAVQQATPAVASVLLQTQVLFVAAGAWLWMGERVGARFMLGTVIAVGGVALMRRGEANGQLSLAGTGWGLCAAACFGMMHVITRRYAQRIPLVHVNAARLWLAVALLSLWPGRLLHALELPAATFGLTALAAFTGPFFGRVCLLYSARHIPAALSALVGVTAPVFTLLVAFLVLGAWPSTRELSGGALVLVGMAVSLRERG